MPAQIKGKHNLRQRKKLRLGEFQEFGFHATAQLVKPLPPEEHEAFIDALIAAAEEHNMTIAGGIGDDGLQLFVGHAAKRQSATNEQREALRAWLAARPELTNIEVSELEDAWFH